MTRIVSIAIAGALLAVAQPAAADITPGPVRVVLPRPPADFDYEDSRPADATSLLYWGSDWGQSSAITQRGLVTWLGSVRKDGTVAFPGSRQTWAPVRIANVMTITMTSITGLRGTVAPSGALQLKGTLRAELGNSCRITAPVRLSTRGGVRLKADKGTFAVKSSPLTVTKYGTCPFIPATMPGLYLKGRMQMPGAPLLPKALRRLDVYVDRVPYVPVAPGGWKQAISRIWTSKAGTVSVTATCTPLGGSSTTPICETRVGPDNSISVRFTGVDRVLVSVTARATPKPGQIATWLPSKSVTTDVTVSYATGTSASSS